MIEVIEPGLLTTVQDLGRPGWGHLGVPAGGAADTWSLAVANVLTGNRPDAAGLEVTLAGPRLRALVDVDVAVAGADLGATAGGRPVWPGRSFRLGAGDDLVLPGPPARASVRAYVAVTGGFDVPIVLGSRSTCLSAGFGGFEGRALRAGDRLVSVASASASRAVDAWPGEPMGPRSREPDGTVAIRVVTAAGMSESLATGRWTVEPASDRMGLRLAPDDGVALAGAEGLPSHGVVRGTIQLPPDGRPIVLGADHQPTGGYPVAGVVITADLPALGQLGPGDRVRFVPVDLLSALDALRALRAAWDSAMAVVRGDTGWDDLWRSAGA